MPECPAFQRGDEWHPNPLPWWEGLGEGEDSGFLHPHFNPPRRGGGESKMPRGLPLGASLKIYTGSHPKYQLSIWYAQCIFGMRPEIRSVSSGLFRSFYRASQFQTNYNGRPRSYSGFCDANEFCFVSCYCVPSTLLLFLRHQSPSEPWCRVDE